MDEFDLIYSIILWIIYYFFVDVGIGDDVVFYIVKYGVQEIVCVDIMVEDVYFKLYYFLFEDIGYKVLVVNISDIVVMGGIFKFYLVLFVVFLKWMEFEIKVMYEGMNELVKLYYMDLIGGDIVFIIDKLVVMVIVIGEVEKG